MLPKNMSDKPFPTGCFPSPLKIPCRAEDVKSG